MYGFIMKKILVSACLAGQRVRYDDKRLPIRDKVLKEWSFKKLLVNVCPEVCGGLKIPRPKAHIMRGNGLDVLNGTAKVLDINGLDVTLSFIKGAEYTLSIIKKFDIEIAILKEKSPSCGVHNIYNISNIVPGSGVTTALLKQNGIKVFSENELARAKLYYG